MLREKNIRTAKEKTVSDFKIVNEPPTERQLDFLLVIDEALNNSPYPPTFRELAKDMGVKSTGTIDGYARILKRKGLVTYETGKPRTIRITEFGYKYVD